MGAYEFLNQYFDKVYVLTLKRATERHAVLPKILKGLNYELFYGIDKSDLDYKTLAEKNVYDDVQSKKLNHSKKSMGLGPIACSLSHRAIYETMLKKNYNKILIFEDDVLPYNENIEQLPVAFQELPKDWELVYLGYLKHEEVTKKMKLKQKFYLPLSYLHLVKQNPKEVRNRLPQRISKHIKRSGEHLCTHAYAVTAEAAKKLIEMQTPIVFNADLLLAHAVLNEKLRAYTFDPQFFAQENFFDPSSPSYVRE